MVVVMTDVDGAPGLTRGADQVARWASSREDLPPCVIALPDPEGEAWLLAMERLQVDERQRKAEAVRVVGFDPRHDPGRLSSTSDRPNDCKRLVRWIFDGEGDLTLELQRMTSPDAERADELAARLTRDRASHKGARLQFRTDLTDALSGVLVNYLPPAP